MHAQLVVTHSKDVSVVYSFFAIPQQFSKLNETLIFPLSA